MLDPDTPIIIASLSCDITSHGFAGLPAGRFRSCQGALGRRNGTDKNRVAGASHHFFAAYRPTDLHLPFLKLALNCS
jgi:hypothetical protein